MGAILILLASIVCLDGTWDFKYLKDRKAKAEKVAWSTIAVPSNWEMQGVGRFVYGEKLTEEYGIYRRRFAVPKDFDAGKNVAYLHFDGVMYGAEVTLNGQKAGMFTSSFNHNTLDVTALLAQDNELIVRTNVKPKGAAFDTNDDWTLHGIFRSVTLEVRPKVHLTDWTISTRIEGDAGIVTLDTVCTEGGRVEATLDGQTAFRLPKAQLWSAEHPVLHDLKMVVRDAEGNVTETIARKVGLREIKWEGLDLTVNGEKVWLIGVNHHDLCPCHGRAIPADEQRRDVAMIKNGGMNFIRCAHYPPSEALLQSCDELGVYVMDEVPFGYGDKLLKDEAYEETLKERVRLTLRRDKNYASVIVWSVGNENPVTPITLVAGKLTGELDTTRPWTFPMTPGVFTNQFATAKAEDRPPIWDWHYPSAELMPKYFDCLDRPLLASEFAHAYGSEAGTELEVVYPMMRQWKGCIGGAVWMFQDQGVERKASTMKPEELVGCVWKDDETVYDSHGLAGSDGVVFADRTPQTAWWELLKVIGRPVELCRSNDLSYTSYSSCPSYTVHARTDRRMTIAKRSAMADGNKKRRKSDPEKVKRFLLGYELVPEVKYTPQEDGTTLVEYSFVATNDYDAAELGLSFDLPKEYTEFHWQGMGPYECYPGRAALDEMGTWHLNKDDLYFPGNRMNVSFAAMTDGDGNGIAIMPVEGTCNVAVEDAPEGGVRFSYNAFVSGAYSKRNWPSDMRHVKAGEVVKGAFKVKNVKLPAGCATPVCPFKRSYDR